MVDRVSKEKRSEIMSAIHSKNTRSTERRLRAGLASARISGWRMNAKDLTGKPDFVFDDKRIAIFVDGCFWHGCKCKRLSKTHRSFWKNKIETNIARDKRVSRELRRQGWKVVRIKEHELKTSVSKVVEKVIRVVARCQNQTWEGKEGRKVGPHPDCGD